MTDESTNKKTRSVPGEVGIWVFVFGDMLVFALLFITYLYYRSLELSLFVDSQATLNAFLGLINTLVLLASSCFVVMSVDALKAYRLPHAKLHLIFAISCGFIFVGIKYFEYSAKLNTGINPLTNDFFMYYFILTGIHLLHVIAGIGGLAFTYFFVLSNDKPESRTIYAECAGIYWHMVDLLWLFLFPLLYLIRS